jgi:hypothetical protein
MLNWPLIELEYHAMGTSDPLELADSLRVRTVLTTITAVRLALDVMQVAFDREATGRLVLLATGPSARPAARPVLFAIKAATRRQ